MFDMFITCKLYNCISNICDLSTKVLVGRTPTIYFILYIHIAGVDHPSTLPLVYFRDNVQTFAE